ncbi:unnamed protein product [Rotaria magnacalcarata]|uniref:N-acetyltransferase domain-containing protein n=1 Tax=Rotaria magnacalcarata TaxID=392030 RepID=A0A819PR88_9BILA|nr:unnamed protein product [Rotaria magnacalcarata]
MNSAPPVNEIDIADKQSLQSVINFLEGYFPDSLTFHHFLSAIQRNTIKPQDLWPNQLLVNDKNDIKCVLFIYSLMSFKSAYKPIAEDEKSMRSDISFFCDNKEDQIFVSMIQHYVPWSKVKKIVFTDFPHRFSSIIESFIRENNLGDAHTVNCQQMELDKETFIENIIFLDIIIRPLTLSDASTINEFWEHKSEISLYRFMYEIEHLLSYGAFRGETLISWCMRKYNGCVANVFTKPEARRLGLASMLNVFMASKILEQEERVFTFVINDNTASVSMLEKLGYKKTDDTDCLTTTMNFAPPVNEIDITDTQSLQPIINFLGGQFPESMELWHLLKDIQRNVIRKKDLWPNQLLVNDKNDIKCVLFIYSLMGFKSTYESVTEEEASMYREINFFCDNKEDQLFVSMIRYYVPWTTAKSIVFSSFPHRFLSIIESFIQENSLGSTHITTCQQMELDKESFKEKYKTMTYACPSGTCFLNNTLAQSQSNIVLDIVIRPLSLSDASTVNDFWEYKSPSSLYRISHEIKYSLAYGASCDEKLIGWCLKRYDSSIGNVFIKPEARRRGLASILNAYMASKILEKEEQVYCFVTKDNVASFSMLQQIGYKRTADADWLVFTPK